ncbi:MAG: polysaccharide biosynthesis tyrosine autokinase [Acidobacteriia bacterium]|nr:polysaccharide biosynthesis tyrosine autokinase [Terriglobia bacterium]
MMPIQSPIPNPAGAPHGRVAQRNRVIYVEPARQPHTEPLGNAWMRYVRSLHRSKLAVILLAVSGCVAGLSITVSEFTRYPAHSSLEIVGANADLLNTRQLNPEADDSNSDTYLTAQVRILQGKSMATRALKKLDAKSRESMIVADPAIDQIKRWLKRPMPSIEQQREDAAAATAKSLTVRAAPGSRIIELSCQSSDPQFAADFLNAIASEYVEQTFELRDSSRKRTEDWLAQQLDLLRRNLADSETQLQLYATNKKLEFTSDKDDVAMLRLRDLQQQLSRAQDERVAAQSEYSVAQQSVADSVPQVLSNERLSGYQQRLTELRRELAEASATMTPEHPTIRRLEAQVEQMNGALKSERVSILNGIANRYQAALKRESLLKGAYADQSRVVAGQSANTIGYDIIKREVETNRTLYESMLQRVKEANIAWTLRATQVRTIEPAEPSVAASQPPLMANGAAGLAGGLILAILLVLGRMKVDQNIRGPGDTQAYLRLPELGVIPSLSADRAAEAALSRPIKGLLNIGELSTGAKEEVGLVTWQRKPSMLAESFRSTLTSLLCLEAHGQSQRLLVVTSPGASEGKTIVTSNLAIALAESKHRVLLIDADMRRPRLHKILNVGNNWGLSDLLNEPTSLENWPIDALVRKTEIPNVFLLPSGPALAHVAGLLYSERMIELLRKFRGAFDYVLLDTPPILSVADARVLSRLADGVILVVRAGQTGRQTASVAAQRLAEDGTPVLGTVLNDWNPAESVYYSYSYFVPHNGKQAS